MTRAKRLRLLILVLLLQAATLVCVWTANRLVGVFTPPPTPDTPSRPLKPPMVPEPPQPKYRMLKKMAFDTKDTLKQWEEKVFKGKSVYEVISEKEQNFLRAQSSNASSGLFLKMDLEMKPDLFLSWSWRATVFPKKKNPDKLADRSQDDFAARVYVIFPGSSFFNTNVIEYIWDENLPEGTLSSSPFSERVKLYVIRSGAARAEDGWQKEQRNVYRDYEKIFKRKPDRRLGAVALMSDSDNTGSQTQADFGEIQLKLLEPPQTAGAAAPDAKPAPEGDEA